MRNMMNDHKRPPRYLDHLCKLSCTDLIEDWKAERTKNVRTIDEIIVHCSATRPGWMVRHTGFIQKEEIKRWHVEDRGWDDIGYHYVIDRTGEVHEGRPIEKAGAHCKGRNAHSVGVCLLGGFGGDADDTVMDHYTREQEDALMGLIRTLRRAYGHLKLSGHNEYAPKACPCFNVRRWWGVVAEEKPLPWPLPGKLSHIIKARYDLWRNK